MKPRREDYDAVLNFFSKQTHDLRRSVAIAELDGQLQVQQRAASDVALSKAANNLRIQFELPRRDPDGRPLWTGDLRGSIAHDDTVAIALLGSETSVVGLDFESRHSISSKDARRNMTATETWGVVDTIDPTIRFSAKESIFKFDATLFDRTPGQSFADFPVNFGNDSAHMQDQSDDGPRTGLFRSPAHPFAIGYWFVNANIVATLFREATN
jgi:hypothetical protein